MLFEYYSPNYVAEMTYRERYLMDDDEEEMEDDDEVDEDDEYDVD